MLLATLPEPHLREMIAQAAIAQAKKATPDWHKDQRDCAGLIRYAYRKAFRNAGDVKAFNGFADAETLVQTAFVRTKQPRMSDVLAYRLDDQYHLMLLVGEYVVYSPGNGTDEVRIGTLRDLETKAPAEWRPIASNPRFLGFYTYVGFTRDNAR